MISVYLLLDLCEEGEGLRRCSSFCGASTVAHFARKVRGTIFWRPSRAKRG